MNLDTQRIRDPVTAASTGAPARIGPNSLIQTVVAMREMLPESTGRAVLDGCGQAGLLLTSPQSMVEESRFVDLVTSLRRRVTADEASAVLERAGVLTGEYLLAHRIPGLARLALPRLPRRIALRVLMKAIAAHAWTFAGAGHFAWQPHRYGASLSLSDCPTARGLAADAPACSYYQGCFETLLRTLIDPHISVRETRCAAQGADVCHFSAAWPAAAGAHLNPLQV